MWGKSSDKIGEGGRLFSAVFSFGVKIIPGHFHLSLLADFWPTMGEKRRRDQKGPSAQQKKRKRTANTQSPENTGDSIVRLDQLNWKKVALPDRLDTVEGFYGLEEIDDVDIVRPDGGGEIQFKVSS